MRSFNLVLPLCTNISEIGFKPLLGMKITAEYFHHMWPLSKLFTEPNNFTFARPHRPSTGLCANLVALKLNEVMF